MSVAFIFSVLALTVAPADRLALADRLFDKGDYALAAAEYAALEGEKSVAADALIYRRAECDRVLGKTASAQTRFQALLAQFPSSPLADTARLRLALASSGEARVRALKLLDSDRVKPALRAEALYHLGEATSDPDAFARCAKIEPKGQYRDHAILHRAALLSKSAKSETRRQSVALFLEIAFGKDAALAESALYLAAATSFSDKQYGEAGSLVRRYLKNFPNGPHAAACIEMAAWCDYLGGRYSDAIVRCGDGKTDGLNYVRAAATQAAGDAAAAKQLFAAYLTAYPQGRYRKESELALARLDYSSAEKSGDASKTIESAQRAFTLSGTASDQLRLAWAYEKGGRHDEAVRAYVAVAEKSPGTSEAAQAMFQKAMIDLRAKRWSAAELALGEALSDAGKLDAHHVAEAQYWRGVAACQLGHEAEGARQLRSALKAGLSLDAGREARLMLADIDFNAGRTNEAIAAYAQLVREGAVARMSAAKMRSVGQLMAPGEKKICAEALTKSASAEWRQAGFALLGEAEEALGNATAAKAAWERCVAEKCETAVLGRVTITLGTLRLKGGDYAGAESLLNKAVALNAKNDAARAEAYFLLAQNALGKGDTEAAKGYATVLVTLFERDRHAAEAAALLKKLETK